MNAGGGVGNDGGVGVGAARWNCVVSAETKEKDSFRDGESVDDTKFAETDEWKDTLLGTSLTIEDSTGEMQLPS